MIDILVPSYNRASDIEHFIIEIQKQSYPNFNVYIIDDHGKDRINHLIPDDKRFVFKRLDNNIGQAGARNVGIEMGKGEIIISLDDDAWFLNDPNALSKTVDYFIRDSDLGCLMYNIKEPEKDYLSEINSLDDGQEIGFHITCGCAYSRKAIEDIGGFNDFFHSGAEETDITFKLIKAGYKLIFSKEIKVYHNFLPEIRTKLWYRQFRKNTTRNDLLIVLMYYPTLMVIPYFFGKWISHINFSFLNKRNRWDATFFTALAGFEALFKARKVVGKRDSLSLKMFKNWLRMRY